MANEVLAVLILARRYLQRGWVQRAAAVGATGTPCSPLSKQAASFCLTGACHRAAFETTAGKPLDREYGPLLASVLTELAPVCLLDDRDREPPLMRLINYNDHAGRTQAVVLAAVEATIKRLEQEGAP